MPVWPRTSSVLIAQFFDTSCPVRHPDLRPVRHPDQHVTYTILPMISSQRPCRRKPALLPLTSVSLSPSLGEGKDRGSTPPPACPGGYPQGGADRSDSSAADARGRKQRQIAATSALRMLPTARAPAWLRQPVASGTAPRPHVHSAVCTAAVVASGVPGPTSGPITPATCKRPRLGRSGPAAAAAALSRGRAACSGGCSTAARHSPPPMTPVGGR